MTTRGHLFAGIDGTRAAWLGLSVLCAYGFADNVFFASARRVGITTALAIASSYPLWAALVGVLWRGERFGLARAGGTLLCVGGIIALIALSPRAVEEHEHSHSTKRDAREGILLALLTSVLWAGNTVSVKMGGTGIDAWHANLIRFFIAWPILAATSALTTRPAKDDAVARAAYRGLVPVSLAEACVGSSLFVYGLAHTDLAVGATLSSLAPLLSVPFALFYREERWSPHALRGRDGDGRRRRHPDHRSLDMKLTVHLTFAGDCDAAFRFTSACSAAPTIARSAGDAPGNTMPPDQLVHASLDLGGYELLGADVPRRQFARPRGFYVFYAADAPADAERIFAALSDGGEVHMPLQKTFWSPCFGVVTDRFGVPWEITVMAA